MTKPKLKNSKQKIYRNSNYIRSKFTDKDEINTFNRIQRELLEKFPKIGCENMVLIELVAAEYIRYVRTFEKDTPRIAKACVKSILEILNELNLTPKSKGVGEVGTTLSQLFKAIQGEEE